MKKILLSTCLFVLLLSYAFAGDKVDINKKPEPLAAKEFPFPKYTEAALKNGIKVFVIEDHEEPTFTIRVIIPGGSSVEGEKSGVAGITAQLLTKGAGKRNALEIAKTLDGVGASVGASAGIDYTTVYGNSLKKHLPLVLEVMSDVILKPTFPGDEFDKLITQTLASIQDEKSNPDVIGAALARKVVYGDNHPYSSKETEKSVKSIDKSDIKDFYKKNFTASNVTIAVVGDFTPDEILPKLEKAFGSWEKGDAKTITVPPIKPMPVGVYFVSRPASVQSAIIVTSPTVPVSDENFEPLKIASNVIGSGFAGRLFRTLRETYSYTYTPYGYQTNSKFANRFSCGADVRNSVTDSAINVIKDQLRDLGTKAPSEDELNLIKKYEVGQYLMSFENSEFVASLIQNADFEGIPMNKIKTYPQRVMSMNPYQIKDLANYYMNPDRAYIVVVGSPDVREKLQAFGKMYDYDLDLNPVSGDNVKMEKVSLDEKDVIEKYVKALGGKDALAKVQTLENNGKVEFKAGNQTFSGSYLQKIKAPNKSFDKLDIGVMKYDNVCDGKSCWRVQNGSVQKLEEKEMDKILFEATLFHYAKILDMGYKAKVLGKQNGQILMKVTSPQGSEATYHFDANTFLLTTVESVEESAQGAMPVTEIYSNYVNVGGVQLPGKIETTYTMFSIKVENSYQVNTPIEDTLFAEPKTKAEN